jgi:hypothetical protein
MAKNSILGIMKKSDISAFKKGFCSVGTLSSSYEFHLREMSLENSFGMTWNAFKATSLSLQKGIDYARR